MKKFNFNNIYEKVEMAGKVYEIRFDDESIIKYHETFTEFYRDTREIQSIDGSKLDDEGLEDLYKEIRSVSRKVLDAVLGEGAYDDLYDKSGKSTMAMVDAITFLSDVVGEALGDIKERQRDRYVKKSD